MSLRRLCAVLVVAAAALSGCGGKKPTMPADAWTALSVANPAPVTDGPSAEIGSAGGVVRGAAVTVDVPEGAVREGHIATVRTGAAPAEAGGQLFGAAVEVEHDAPLGKEAILRWSAADLTPHQRATAVLARWYPDVRKWRVEERALTVSGDTISATVREFSFWTWIADVGQGVGDTVGARVDAPACSGKPLPSWVRDFVDPDEDLSAAAIRVCAEPDKGDVVTTRIANNRTFAQRIVLTPDDERWAWTWPGPSDPSPSGIVHRLAHEVLGSERSMIVPPLKTVAVGLDRPAVPGQRVITGTSRVDGFSVLVDVGAYVVNKLSVPSLGNPLLTAVVQALYECAAKEGLGLVASRDAAEIVRAVLRAVGGCADEIRRPKSTFGARFEALSLKIIQSSPGATADRVVDANRLSYQLAGAFKVLTFGELAFYVSDQLANAAVGPLGFAFRGDGRPQPLGGWKPGCANIKNDGNLLYRNVALQDAFTDKSKELWQFPEWAAAARTAVRPLEACDDDHLQRLATYLPGAWGDRRGAEVVANEIRRLTPFPTVVTDRQLGSACPGMCVITGRTWFTHPAWGPVVLLTTLAGTEPAEGRILVVDPGGTVRWSYETGIWYELEPNNPARDRTGHLFVNYNPGRYNGVIVLGPSQSGFDDYATLPTPGDYAQRFYSAHVRDGDKDGTFEISSEINQCDPDCASGKIRKVVYRWSNGNYRP